MVGKGDGFFRITEKLTCKSSRTLNKPIAAVFPANRTNQRTFTKYISPEFIQIFRAAIVPLVLRLLISQKSIGHRIFQPARAAALLKHAGLKTNKTNSVPVILLFAVTLVF
jgi:hypothetical protein